jgi:hypothetical protein
MVRAPPRSSSKAAQARAPPRSFSKVARARMVQEVLVQGGETSTYNYGRWLLLPLYVANDGLLPRHLDLGLTDLDPG